MVEKNSMFLHRTQKGRKRDRDETNVISSNKIGLPRVELLHLAFDSDCKIPSKVQEEAWREITRFSDWLREVMTKSLESDQGKVNLKTFLSREQGLRDIFLSGKQVDTHVLNCRFGESLLELITLLLHDHSLLTSSFMTDDLSFLTWMLFCKESTQSRETWFLLTFYGSFAQEIHSLRVVTDSFYVDAQKGRERERVVSLFACCVYMLSISMKWPSILWFGIREYFTSREDTQTRETDMHA